MASKPDINSAVKDLYGLVVCGGNSSRMGTDKSLLTYYDKPQRYHVYDMLQPFCEQVFISVNAEQQNTIEPGYQFLTDNALYNNTGPMAALLTAFSNFPGKNIMFIGCDYPFLSASDLQQFLSFCIDDDRAVAFYNEDADMYEPLLGWYPYHLFEDLKKRFTLKQFSLQHFLTENKAIKFYPPTGNSIVSIDSPEAYIKALDLLKSSPTNISFSNFNP